MYYGISPQAGATMSPESRRRLGMMYSSILGSNYGSATQAVIAENQRKLEEEQRAADVAAREKEYQLNQDSLNLQKDIAEQSADQAEMGSYLNYAGLGMQVADYIPEGTVGKTFSGISNMFSGQGSAPTGVGADIAASEVAAQTTGSIGSTASSAIGGSGISSFSGVGADIAAAEAAGAEAGSIGTSTASGSSGGGVGTGFSTAGGIATVALIGQSLAASNTDTEFEGQKSGGVFTFEDGEYRPRFGNDPWMGYMHDKFNMEPTAGEKWDAAIHNEDWGTALKRTPAVMYQWLNPGATTVTNLVDKGWEKAGVNDDWREAGKFLLDPVHSLVDKVSDSYICGATNEIVGMDKEDMKLLQKMYIHALHKRSSLGEYYMNHGKELVRIMTSTVRDPEKFYMFIKENMLIPTLEKLRVDDLDGGLDIYISYCKNLFKEFSPDLYDGIPEETDE